MRLRINLLFAALAFVFVQSANAQITSSGIANTYLIEGDILDGDIVSLIPGSDKLTRAIVEYDEQMFGVIVLNPEIVYRRVDEGLPVMRHGEAFVNITTLNGDILSGDYITSSSVPGFGQKATELAGFVLGKALTSFTATEGAQVRVKDTNVASGQVKLALGIGPASPVQVRASGGVFGTVRFVTSSLFSTIATSRQAERVVRIILAAFIAVLTIFVNFRTFGRNITKGIEGIGRNPLARGTIQSMIILNIILIGGVTLGGILLSLIILSL